MPITGKDLIDLGFQPGRDLGCALETVRGRGLTGDALADWVAAHKPAAKISSQEAPGTQINFEAENEAEQDNVARGLATMDVLMQTPRLRAGAVMPDACPAAPEGTIPVGDVVAAQNAIYPGMHAADICCCVMVTEFTDGDSKTLLDAVHKVTHFGPGGRRNGQRHTLSPALQLVRKWTKGNHNCIHQAATVKAGTEVHARFYSGNVDISELPSADKPAATVRAQMKRYGFADGVDEIVPYGAIMAGDWERDAPWRKKAQAKWAARNASNT